MPAIQLSPAQRKEHRAAAHHLEPVVMIGGDGLTDNIRAEADAALKAHGLIKIRVFNDDRKQRDEWLAALADQLDAAPIQHIGKLLVLWRPMPKVEAAVPSQAEINARPRVVKILKFSKSGSQRAQVKKLTVFGNQRVTAGGIVKRSKTRPVSTKKRSQSD
jgi:putative YhbY family RNA-binding protein